MENNYFEKQVQDRMADFKVQPSPENWSAIESRIRKKEINKRFIWLFFAGLLLLVGGSYLLSQQEHTRVSQVTQLPPNKTQNLPASDIENISIIPPIQKESSGKAPHDKVPFPEPVKKNSLSSGLLTPGSKEKEKRTAKPLIKEPVYLTEPGFIKRESLEESDHYTKPAELTIKSGHEALLNTNSPSLQPASSLPGLKPVNQAVRSDKVNGEEKKDYPEKVGDQTGELSKIEMQDSSPNLAANNKIEIEPGVKASLSKSNWEWGFTLSGGKAISGNGIKFALVEDNKSFDLNSPVNNLASGYSITRPASISISKPVSPVGFKAGLVVKKILKPGVYLASGLNYTYYSNTLQINTQTSFGNADYATNKNQYRNNFHFLELPVFSEFELNGHKKIPLRLSAGATLSRLLISDAVEFKDGYFVREGSLLNKTQVGISAGFSATFFKKFSLGPIVNYGLGEIADQGVFANKHWNYIGLRLDYLLKK